MKIEGIATILYHQDPITGFKAYKTEAVEVPAKLVLKGLGLWAIRLKYPFQHTTLDEEIELGINHPYSSNSNIWVDYESSAIPEIMPCERFEMIIKENKFERNEAPWAQPRKFSLYFIR